MRDQCFNCGVLLGPLLVSLGLIVGGLSSKILNWSDLKDRTVMIAEVGTALLVLSAAWMFVQLFLYEEIDYLRLLGPALTGLAVTGAGVYRLRGDVNFSGLDTTYAGLGLFFGSLLWIFWVLQAFS